MIPGAGSDSGPGRRRKETLSLPLLSLRAAGCKSIAAVVHSQQQTSGLLGWEHSAAGRMQQRGASSYGDTPCRCQRMCQRPAGNVKFHAAPPCASPACMQPALALHQPEAAAAPGCAAQSAGPGQPTHRQAGLADAPDALAHPNAGVSQPPHTPAGVVLLALIARDATLGSAHALNDCSCRVCGPAAISADTTGPPASN